MTDKRRREMVKIISLSLSLQFLNSLHFIHNIMSVFRNILLGCCFVCAFACNSSQNKPLNNVIVVPFIDDKPEPFVADRFFSDIKFVPLETNENCLLSSAQQVEFRDSLIFICDDYRLFMFNDKGKFISQFGREGRGPGEYAGGFRGFFVDMEKRTVNIITPVSKSIMVYSFDGAYLFSEEIPSDLYDWGYFAMTVDNNKVFIFNSYNPGNNMAYTLMDRNNIQRVLYFCTYDPVKIDNYTYHFATHPMTRLEENKIHFTMPLDPHIYEYSSGEVNAKYYIVTPSKILPKEVMQREDGTYFSKLIKFTRTNYFGGFTDIFETDHLIFLHYMANLSYPGLYVLDKNNATGNYYTFPLTEGKFTSPIFRFSASDGNRLVSVVPIGEVMKLKEYMAENEIDDGEVYVDLRKSLNGINKESNPLLVFYTTITTDVTL